MGALASQSSMLTAEGRGDGETGTGARRWTLRFDIVDVLSHLRMKVRHRHVFPEPRITFMLELVPFQASRSILAWISAR